MAISNNNLPPPPARTPLTMENGTTSPVWLQWFNILYQRTGGGTVTPLGDLEQMNSWDANLSHSHAISHINGLSALLSGYNNIFNAEIDLGLVPLTSGSFTITGTGYTVGKNVFIQQATGPYTDKGTLADESEMDALNVTATVTNSTTITANWSASMPVLGKFKFNYMIGA